MDNSFRDRWNRKWSLLGFQDIGNEFLDCCSDMLPSEAAPCLSFDYASEPALIWRVFGTPSQWSADVRARLDPCRMIGSDGAGNPICLEFNSGAIVLLDHEDRFHIRQFVNGSVRQLAECLIAYMGEHDSDRFRAAIQPIDAAALAEGHFGGLRRMVSTTIDETV